MSRSSGSGSEAGGWPAFARKFTGALRRGRAIARGAVDASGGGSERGQTTTEYVTVVGMVAGMAILVSNVLGLSLREAFRSVAQRMLSVITGP